MLKGIDSINISSCKTIKPDTSGYDGQTVYDVVRNPNWNPKIDPFSKNYPDEIVFTVDSSDVDIYNKIEAGQLDMATSSIPPDVLKKYATTASLKPYFHQNQGDRTWYLTMNLTQPPFDDIHVREAMNWIIEQDSADPVPGQGRRSGSVANHIVPDTLFDGQMTEYAPYATPGNTGSLAKAKAAMMGSVYDTQNNGMCDAAACKNVLMIFGRHASLWASEDGRSIISQDAAEIGITLTGADAQRTPTRRSRHRRRTSRSASARAGVRTTPTRYTLLVRALRGLLDHRGRERQLLAARHHPGAVQDARGHGATASRTTQRPDHVPSVNKHAQRAASRSPAQSRFSLLRERGQVPDDEGRPVGSLPRLVRHRASRAPNVTHYQYDQFTDDTRVREYRGELANRARPLLSGRCPGAPAATLIHAQMAPLHHSPLGLDGRRRPRRRPRHLRGLLPAADRATRRCASAERRRRRPVPSAGRRDRPAPQQALLHRVRLLREGARDGRLLRLAGPRLLLHGNYVSKLRSEIVRSARRGRRSG